MLDTGPRTAADNIAFDYVLLRGLESCPRCILRFREFSTPAVTVGYNQTVDEVVNEAFCRRRGIHIARRLTGGGAIYLDEHCLGWEIMAPISHLTPFASNEALYGIVSQPIVRALSTFGLPARVRPKNDVEVRGRKVSGMAATRVKDSLLVQGTLLTAVDSQSMASALKPNPTKLKRKGACSISERVTSLEDELGRPVGKHAVKSSLREAFEAELHLQLVKTNLSAQERRSFYHYREFFGSDDWSFRIGHDLIPF